MIDSPQEACCRERPSRNDYGVAIASNVRGTFVVKWGVTGWLHGTGQNLHSSACAWRAPPPEKIASRSQALGGVPNGEINATRVHIFGCCRFGGLRSARKQNSSNQPPRARSPRPRGGPVMALRQTW